MSIIVVISSRDQFDIPKKPLYLNKTNEQNQYRKSNWRRQTVRYPSWIWYFWYLAITQIPIQALYNYSRNILQVEMVNTSFSVIISLIFTSPRENIFYASLMGMATVKIVLLYAEQFSCIWFVCRVTQRIWHLNRSCPFLCELRLHKTCPFFVWTSFAQNVFVLFVYCFSLTRWFYRTRKVPVGQLCMLYWPLKRCKPWMIGCFIFADVVQKIG